MAGEASTSMAAGRAEMLAGGGLIPGSPAEDFPAQSINQSINQSIM
jgi:hypothetical protein